MMLIKCLPLLFIGYIISDSLLRGCSCRSFLSEFFSINVQCLINLSVAGSCLCVTVSNSIGYSSWSGISITFLPVCILIDLILLSLPMKIFSTIPIFHFLRFFPSPFIMTTLLILISTSFSLWLRLCLSLRPAKYSWTYLLQAASLHLCAYLYRFFQLSLTSSSSGKSSGNLISLPRIVEFGVNTEYPKSSSIYVNGRLFRLTSTSKILLLTLTTLTMIYQWIYTDFAL